LGSLSLTRVAWCTVSLPKMVKNESNGYTFAPKTYYSKIAYTKSLLWPK